MFVPAASKHSRVTSWRPEPTCCPCGSPSRYTKFYELLMNGGKVVLESEKEEVIGAFATRLDVVETFRLAGVPMYYVRPVSLFTKQVIRNQFTLQQPPQTISAIPT